MKGDSLYSVTLFDWKL